MAYKVIKAEGSLSGGLLNPPDYEKEHIFDNFEDAFKKYLEIKKECFVHGSPDYEDEWTRPTSIDYLVSRGFGISDCSEYMKATISWS